MTDNHTGRGLDFLRHRDLPFYTLTFARDLTAAQLLARMGADPETVAVRDRRQLSLDLGDLLSNENEPVVTTGSSGPWSWAWEQAGVHGLTTRILQAVSAGTEAVVLHHNPEAYVFTHACDGVVSSTFNTLQRDPPATTDAHLRQHLPVLARSSDDPHSVLTLLEDAFGLQLTRDSATVQPNLSGRLRSIR